MNPIRLLLAAALFPAALLATGCAAATGCDFREGSANGPEPRCQERTMLQASGFGAVCEGLGGTAVDGGCPSEGIVGGCTTDAGTGTITDWYYDPITEAEIQETCVNDGSTYEAAPG